MLRKLCNLWFLPDGFVCEMWIVGCYGLWVVQVNCVTRIIPALYLNDHRFTLEKRWKCLSAPRDSTLHVCPS